MNFPEQITPVKPYNPVDDCDTVVENSETEIITKKVLYKKDGTMVVFHTGVVNVAARKAELEANIASMQAEREALVTVATEKNISLTPVSISE